MKDTGEIERIVPLLALLTAFPAFSTDSMWLVSQDWMDRIQILGIIALSCGALVLSAWTILQKKSISRSQRD
ncbi:hypothetical protein Mpsy_1986 [Methanolobus psychrophilus R15]|nr:hypothetical protein Mpsy_1986 [Methanolobus psychrophilus R15]